MTTGNSNGYIAFEKMYQYSLHSNMYNVQPSHFVYAMETFLLLWILGFMFYPSLIQWRRTIINSLKITSTVISRRDNRSKSMAQKNAKANSQNVAP